MSKRKTGIQTPERPRERPRHLLVPPRALGAASSENGAGEVPVRPALRRTGSGLASMSFIMAMLLGVMISILLPDRSAGAAAPAPPLLFGENLDLYPGTAGSDWFLSQPALRAGLVNAHVQVIRLPVRGSTPSSPGIANWPELQAALQDINTLNLTPLIILRNPQDPSLQADDSQVVSYVNSLFGSSQVYYEWANETDLPNDAGQVSAATYLASWNAHVPQLKALANPGAQFIGPTNYQYDPGYLQTFLAGANPPPDAISWHTYTCDDATATEATCLDNIDHWTGDFAAARTLMTSTIGRQLPIWITEWNYTPTVTAKDPKHTDTAFLQQWTTKALQTLAADGIAASMHFNVNNLHATDGSFPLVNFDGSLAPEGVAFSAAYTTLTAPGGSSFSASASAAPTPSTGPSTNPSPSSSPSSSPSASAPSSSPPTGVPQYSFEDATLDGWETSDNITSLVNSTDVPGQDGNHELEAVFHATGSGDFPTLHVSPAHGPTAGQTLTAYLYVPASTATTVTAKLFYQNPTSPFRWITGDTTVISQRGAWVQLSLPVSGITAASPQIGVQLQEAPFNTNSTIFVDSVGWS